MFIFQHFRFFEQLEFHAQLSSAWKRFGSAQLKLKLV